MTRPSATTRTSAQCTWACRSSYPVDEQFLNPATYPTSMHGGFFLLDIMLLAAFLYALYELCWRANRYLETKLSSVTSADTAAHR